jgi:hypothetical protein
MMSKKVAEGVTNGSAKRMSRETAPTEVATCVTTRLTTATMLRI